MWKQHINAIDLDQTIDLLNRFQGTGRIIAGGTDLILEIERGVRNNIEQLIDISRVEGLDKIRLDDEGLIHIGPMVTHNQMIADPLARKYAYPLAEACWRVGSPQIRNRATIAGNLITASPANDTVPPLMALDASVSLRSTAGTRSVRLRDFYSGVRKCDMKPDEMLIDICFNGMKENQAGAFYKFGLRNAQAISVVNACVILDLEGKKILNAIITLGAVAPTIIHAQQAEKSLVGKQLIDEVIDEAAKLAAQDSKPIDDLRASAAFRRHLVHVCVKKSLETILNRTHAHVLPETPVLLSTAGNSIKVTDDPSEIIQTTINGKHYAFPNCRDKTLLQLIREDAGLTGTKEGCAEGECGACTIFLDGKAVMSCLVPAGRAHTAVITTIEGLEVDGKLNPVQQGFVEKGAVQCGYCTPGMIMSVTKLLEEKPAPGVEEIQQALAGNLCRCTGYYQIIEAVEAAIVR
jgi:xanthine dehydrogenase iron-sulfur cluster and FAD-binding subunit A